MEYYVYQLRLFNSSLPFYIGKGKDERCFSHLLPKNYNSAINPIKNGIIRKAISEGIEILVEKLEVGLSNELAGEREVFYIKHFGRRGKGGCLSNLTDGGKAETRLKTQRLKRLGGSQ